MRTVVVFRNSSSSFRRAPGPDPARPERLLIAAADRVGVPPRDLTPAAVALRARVESFGGRVAALDEALLLATFGSPTDALQCAAEVQVGLREVGLRAGVAAGEVNELHSTPEGPAVAQAAALSETAAPGEVLFSRGVGLTMTKSEVSFAAAQLPTGEAAFRIDAGQNGASRGFAPAGASGASGAASPASRVLGRPARAVGRRATLIVFGALAALVRASARRSGAIVIGLLLVIGLGAALGAERMGRAKNERAIEEALATDRPQVALQRARAWVTGAPERPVPRLWLALALAESHQPEDALAELRKVFDADPANAEYPVFGRALVRTLDREDAVTSRVLAAAAGPRVEAALIAGTRSIRYNERWNAFHTLEEIGEQAKADRLQMFALDVQYASSCRTRQRSLKQLSDIDDPRALPHLLRARTGLDADARRCTGLVGELNQTIEKLEKQGR
jgi:hypothetical protein